MFREFGTADFLAGKRLVFDIKADSATSVAPIKVRSAGKVPQN